MTKVLHILPEDGIGGTEVAARNAAQKHKDINILFLSANSNYLKQEERIRYSSSKNPFYLSAITKTICLTDKIQPDVVVFSLWKSFGAFMILRLFRPNMKFVLLLHSDRSVHVFDHWLTKIMAYLSHSVWADSAASLQRLSQPKHYRTRIISFLLHTTKKIEHRKPSPNFIYWGRLQKLKNIPAALDFFALIAREYQDAKFTLIGPNAGMEAELKEQVKYLGLDSHVYFMGYRTYSEIVKLTKDASFFLQLSDQEGMAMSVVEAMQLGLVTIATPVGEIANYCHDLENSILYTDPENTARKVKSLLHDFTSFSRISTQAIKTWSNQPLYSDDFLAAAHDLNYSSSKK